MVNNKTINKAFVCEGCNEKIAKAENFSEDPKLCYSCFNQKEAVEIDECLVCCGKGAKTKYGGQCKDCFDDDEEVEVFGLIREEELGKVEESV